MKMFVAVCRVTNIGSTRCCLSKCHSAIILQLGRNFARDESNLSVNVCQTHATAIMIAKNNGNHLTHFNDNDKYAS